MGGIYSLPSRNSFPATADEVPCWGGIHFFVNAVSQPFPHQKWVLLAGAGKSRTGRQSLYLLCRHVGIGAKDDGCAEQLRRGPFDECLYVFGNRHRRGAVDVGEDCIEDRSGGSGKGAHERIELVIEFAEKQQRSSAQHHESRIANRLNLVRGLEQRRQLRREMIQQGLCVSVLFQGKT